MLGRVSVADVEDAFVAGAPYCVMWRSVSMVENYQCPKCGNTECDVDEVAMTGVGFSRFFDIQNRKFSLVTCKKCTYTEFYRTRMGKLSQILDLFIDG